MNNNGKKPNFSDYFGLMCGLGVIMLMFIGSFSSSKTDSNLKWSNNSDGYTWESASYSEKMHLCKKLSLFSDNENSAQYFYDSLNEFYTPDNLDTSIDTITSLIESVSRGGR